jgi:site-specific DNA-methyltransferase (adenine-specific)
VLDEVFGEAQFQSEIIWTYKRWSNTKRGLLNAHQTIHWYTKTSKFKFNKIYTEYSPTTNVEQILQNRTTDKTGKTVYEKDTAGNVITGYAKIGVPLSNVWDIPYLNPTAKERVGYPTQKPIELLDKILSISTEAGDLVIYPFCGSGTTCVSAKLMGRRFIGIDKCKSAVKLATDRLSNIVVSRSSVLEKGRDTYAKKSEKEVELLRLINATPVQRNSKIDGLLKTNYDGLPVFIKIVNVGENLQEIANNLKEASKKKGSKLNILMLEC